VLLRARQSLESQSSTKFHDQETGVAKCGAREEWNADERRSSGFARIKKQMRCIDHETQ
jgi:hypothetical protein